MNMEKLLLIEDDIEICEMVKKYLTNEGFELITAHNGETGCKAFQDDAFDLILLDIMMPKLDGFNVIQRIRATSTVPIIILSARDTEFDKVSGLGMGADDYLTKPFSMVELLARIKSNLRRSIQYAHPDDNSINEELKAGEIVLKPDEFCIIKKGHKIELTAKEFEILRLMMLNPTRVYTKAQIYTRVWGDNYFGDENAVNVQISRLRSKIEDNPKNPQYIKTIWGIGYKLGD
ncbi:MAG: response regulator transcription factor [Lachnospiraceae bacterium]